MSPEYRQWGLGVAPESGQRLPKFPQLGAVFVWVPLLLLCGVSVHVLCECDVVVNAFGKNMPASTPSGNPAAGAKAVHCEREERERDKRERGCANPACQGSTLLIVHTQQAQHCQEYNCCTLGLCCKLRCAAGRHTSEAATMIATLHVNQTGTAAKLRFVKVRLCWLR